MAVGETAELLVLLRLRDEASGAAKGAEQKFGQLGKTATSTAGAVARAETSTTRFGGSLNRLGGYASHAKGAIGELISGPLGLIGLGTALFSVGGLIEKGVESAQSLATATEKLTAVTGESVEMASAQIAVFEKYGLSADRATTFAAFAEKTIGKLADTMSGKGAKAVSKLTDLDKQFGINLETSKGKAVGFQTELLRVADYYNSSATAGQKATLAAQLFGRGYVQLIPILKLGSKGINEAEEGAKALGETLTAQNATELRDYIANQRELGATFHALELQVGLAVIPIISKFEKGLTGFLQNGGAKQIASFFTQAASGAAQLAGTMGDAWHAAQPFFSGILGAWNALPEPLKTLLVGGAVAGKASSFLFGANPFTALLKGGIGAVTGGLMNRGGTPANPLFVADVTGGGGGAAGAIEGAAGKGGLSAGGIIASVGGGLAIAAIFKTLVLDPTLNRQSADIRHNALAEIRAPATSHADLVKGLAATNTGLSQLNEGNPITQLLYGQQISDLEKTRQMYLNALAQEVKPVSATGTPGGLGEGGSKTLPTAKATLAAIKNQGINLAAIKQHQQQLLAQQRVTSDRIGNAIAASARAITGSQTQGFGGVIGQLGAVIAAIMSVGTFGGAAALGRGTAPGGRVATTAAQRAASAPVGTENNRNYIHIAVQATSSARSNDSATSAQTRYGPTPSRAGSAVVLVGGR